MTVLHSTSFHQQPPPSTFHTSYRTRMSESNEQLPEEKPLCSVWDDPKIMRYHADDGSKRWKCTYCGNHYAGWSATKALAHVALQKYRDIAFCTHRFTEKQRKRFEELIKGKNKKRDASAVASETHNINIIQHNISTASTLDTCKKEEQCIICDQHVEHCKGCSIK